MKRDYFFKPIVHYSRIYKGNRRISQFMQIIKVQTRRDQQLEQTNENINEKPLTKTYPVLNGFPTEFFGNFKEK